MAQAGTKRVTAKDPNEKLAQRRRTVLEVALRLGNVYEACRRGGIDRTSFYGWKRRFQMHGLDGLKDLPPVHKSRPMTTPPEVVERLLALALEHPAYGFNRPEALLALEGRRVSAITNHKILNAKDLGSREQRWLALKAKTAREPIELSPEQVAFLEKLNPCFRERHVESGAPGELLSADTSMVGALQGIGRVYLHALVDTYGSYAFGFLHVSKQPEAALTLLHNDVLPFYRGLDLPVRAVLTDNGREILRHRAAPVRAGPGAERDRAPHHQGRLAQDQRLRRALQRHRPAGIPPPGSAPTALRERRGAAGRPLRVAAPLQPRPAPPRLPQPEPLTVGNHRPVRRTKSLSSR